MWMRLAGMPVERPKLLDAETEAYARRSDPDTSHEAAESVKLSQLEAVVLEALKQFQNGATASELCAHLEMEWQSVSPRLAPLCRKGYAFDTTERRPGPSGRKQIVWKATTQEQNNEN